MKIFSVNLELFGSPLALNSRDPLRLMSVELAGIVQEMIGQQVDRCDCRLAHQSRSKIHAMGDFRR